MASEITKRTPECVVCALQHHTTQSSHWCIECEEPLCAAFKQHHTVLKATRNHKTIPIFDYLSLPTAVTDIKQHCIYHNEKYQLYCVKHESPICNNYVKDHGKCGEILPLDELVKDVKTSESVVDPEQSLDDISTNINIILKDRESYIKTGEYLFTNYESLNEKVVTINGNGKVKYTIPLKEPYGVFDVACLDDSTVAISTRFSMNASGISLVKLTKRKVIQFMDLPDDPYGMTYDGKSLICYVEDEDLQVISCTDYSITTIPYTASPCYSFV
ncbi:Hypothetical predicted protein [Mytilus galloprovincialis]|uniref:B box-type domain-containing protein n=1 Tax=Mytilus galloprovincialis TaxID=29158 RepID=A0A8B6FUD5_MYTGA|nr:Hypothetical predicted protein [Mytilus galloprovincialis]